MARELAVVLQGCSFPGQVGRELAVVKRLAVGAIETMVLAASVQQVNGSCGAGPVEAMVPR